MKENILDIARTLMREKGDAALSRNEIARQLGMKTPSLYVYYANKMALYDALFRRGVDLFAQRMAADNQPGGPLVEQLQWAIEGYMTFAIENPDLYQLVFERPVPGFVPSEESMAASLEVLQGARDGLAQVLYAGGLATNLPLEAASDLTLAMAHGLTALHMANEPHLPLGEGRFGSLTREAADIFQRAWEIEE